jgi:hypothetical protein
LLQRGNVDFGVSITGCKVAQLFSLQIEELNLLSGFGANNVQAALGRIGVAVQADAERGVGVAVNYL